mgnify:CR=1 FL=1
MAARVDEYDRLVIQCTDSDVFDASTTYYTYDGENAIAGSRSISSDEYTIVNQNRELVPDNQDGLTTTFTVNYTEAGITESDTFDITIVNGQLTTRTHSTYNWNAECNTNVNGYNIFHDNSGAIDKVIEPVMAMETHSDETVKAFQDFIDENCYFKALFCEIAYGACANWIHNTGAVTGAKGMLNIGGITYDWANSGK